MFEGFLEKFLLKYFGEYLKGVDKSNLSVAVWKGEILVKTVDINPDILKKFNLPLKMVFGKIESLLLKVPWNNLSSKPVELFIDSINVVLALENISEWYSEKNYLDFCQVLLDSVKDEMTRKLEEEFEKQEKKSSFFEQIFDNLIINVKNIHVRLENTKGNLFCFGWILEDFAIRSVDSEGKPIFVKRQTSLDRVTKLIAFKNMQLYHENKILSDKDVNILVYYFKSTKAHDAFKILNLSLDLLFTLSPYPKDTKDFNIVPAVYQLTTEVNNVELSFKTVTIRDMADLMEYFGNYSQSKFE